MQLKQRVSPRTLRFKQNNFILLTAFGLIGLPSAAHAQSVTAKQLKVVLPDETTFTGLTRLRPAGENYLLPVFSQEQDKWIQPISPAVLLQDHISLGTDTAKTFDALSGDKLVLGRINRQLYSLDGGYSVTMTADVFATTADAMTETIAFGRGCSSPFVFGRPSQPAQFDPHTYSFLGRPAGSVAFGDESYYNVNKHSTMLLRVGRMLVLIDGNLAGHTSTFGKTAEPLAAMIEKIAADIVKRASVLPGLAH